MFLYLLNIIWFTSANYQFILVLFKLLLENNSICLISLFINFQR